MAVFFTRRGEPPSLGKQLSDYTEGDIVKIPENNTSVEFYVAKHDYESGLNGNGRTLVVRKDCYDLRQWHSSNVNAWASCSMRSWLNSTYKALLDSNIQEAMSTTTYRYTPGNGSWSVDTRSDAVFLLSATELGQSASWFNVEGSALPIADTLKVAHLNGITSYQWTRSPVMGFATNATSLRSEGEAYSNRCISTYGSRPAFTLPSTTKFDPDTNIIIG